MSRDSSSATYHSFTTEGRIEQLLFTDLFRYFFKLPVKKMVMDRHSINQLVAEIQNQMALHLDHDTRLPVAPARRTHVFSPAHITHLSSLSLAGH